MVVAEYMKIYNYPSTFFSIRFLNFAFTNSIENKDIIYPKTMGFNCTFMELKSTCLAHVRRRNERFNCTFMELKSKIGSSGDYAKTVLIVPLWN